MIYYERTDPQWKKIGASLRKNKLYLKIPRLNAIQLVAELGGPKATDYSRQTEVFLREQISQTKHVVLFLEIGADEAWKDLEMLSDFDTPVVQDYCWAIRAGMANSYAVDWIARVGGPKAEPSLELDPL